MLAAAAASISLVVAAPAHADNASDFLAVVSGLGINVGDTPPDVSLTLAAGELVCQLLHYDSTPQEAGRNVLYTFPNATPQQVSGFVDAAQDKLCEQSYGPLQLGN